MIDYHIDTDMGVDDGLALVHAHHLLQSRITAVSTVFGNVPQAQALANALLFQTLLAPPVGFSVYRGADVASDGTARHAIDVHGHDGLGGASGQLDAAILRHVARQPQPRPIADIAAVNAISHKICIIGLGPATNIPSLVASYGAENIASIVLMSGVFFDTGNITPFAEFNAYGDPDALRTTLGLGVPVTFVPLDLCRKILLTRDIVRSYNRHASPLSKLVVESHMTYMDYYRSWEGIDGCFPHDTIAVLVATKPEWFSLYPATVSVDSHGDYRGRTALTFQDRSHINIAMGGALKSVREMLQTWPSQRGERKPDRPKSGVWQTR